MGFAKITKSRCHWLKFKFFRIEIAVSLNNLSVLSVILFLHINASLEIYSS